MTDKSDAGSLIDEGFIVNGAIVDCNVRTCTKCKRAHVDHFGDESVLKFCYVGEVDIGVVVFIELVEARRRDHANAWAGETFRKFLDAGENPPHGVVISYYLKEKPAEEIILSVLDSSGQLIKTFSSQAAGKEAKDGAEEPRLRTQPGMNRFIWNMRYPNARKVQGDKTTEEMLTGPTAPPGTYQVSLAAGGPEQTQTFEIVKDPRVSASQADLETQFQLLIAIRDKLSETHDSINQLRSIRRQVEEWEQRSASHTSAEAVSGHGVCALCGRCVSVLFAVQRTSRKRLIRPMPTSRPSARSRARFSGRLPPYPPSAPPAPTTR